MGKRPRIPGRGQRRVIAELGLRTASGRSRQARERKSFSSWARSLRAVPSPPLLLLCGALLEAGRDDLEAGPVEGPGGRGQLGDHLGAVAALFDHLDDAADLALGAAEPLDYVRHRLAVHVHGNSLSVGPGPPAPEGCQLPEIVQ